MGLGAVCMFNAQPNLDHIGRVGGQWSQRNGGRGIRADPDDDIV